MKDSHPDREAAETPDVDPWLKDGLRALREQAPSDESRRAALAALGIGDPGVAPVPAPATSAAHARGTGRGLLLWLLGGALLGVLALVLQRWFE